MTVSTSPGFVCVGVRVKLTQKTLMTEAGRTGTLTRKYVPAHCTGAWSITVKWDGNKHETSYPYPNGIVARI